MRLEYKTSWTTELNIAMKDDDVLLHCTLSKKERDKPFDSGFGGVEGEPFTAWSEEWVYFPTEYDGAERVARVRRHPCNIPTEHI